MALKIEEIIHRLSAGGWSAKDFAANQLGYAADRYLGTDGAASRALFDRYWRTVAEITTRLKDAGVDHVVLKTRRHYRYADTNVDVFVRDAEWPATRDALCGSDWQMPSRAIRFKQRLIEREKIKLPPRADTLVPAHIYKSVCWRYQREVSFLEEGMTELVPLEAEAPSLASEWGGVMIPMSTRAADILIHCAEIVFENYRIALGETLYLSWLLSQVPDVEQREVFRMGVARGAGGAMRTALAYAELVGDEKYWDDIDLQWPKRFSARELITSWKERLGMQVKQGNLWAAMEEGFGYGAFASMYHVKRSYFE